MKEFLDGKGLIITIMFAICAVLFGYDTYLTKTTTVENKNFAGEVWQGTRDGKPSEGSLFYRLEFGNDNTVTVLKQSGGFNDSEVKTWAINDAGQLVILGSDDALIADFNGAYMSLKTGTDMVFHLEGDKFNLHQWFQYRALIHISLFFIGLMILNELCRHYKPMNYLFWFVLPVVLIPLWLSYDVSYWFKWVKLYSVVGAALLFTLIRFTKVGDYKWAKFGAAAFLAINIAEAVTQDFSMGNLANNLNAVGGILSIITLSGWAMIHADKTAQKDMVWPAMTSFWIIAYDVWNIAFVYLNFPGSATGQAMVLIAATLPAMIIKPGTWLQARAFTLAAAFMYYFTCPFMLESNVIVLPRNDLLMLLAGLSSFVINAVYAVMFFKLKFNNKKLQTA